MEGVQFRRLKYNEKVLWSLFDITIRLFLNKYLWVDQPHHV
jgi:hypothetical protein